MRNSHDSDEQLWRDLLSAAKHDDGAAAQRHLEAGRPIYYAEDDTPEGLLIKEYPNGRRELVRPIPHSKVDEIIQIL